MVSSRYTKLHTVGNLGTSLSCFTGSSSLPSNPTVTYCKGHGFGAEPAVVLGNRIPYDSTFFFFFLAIGPAQAAEVTCLNLFPCLFCWLPTFFSLGSGKVGKNGLSVPSSTAGVCPSERVPTVWADWKEKSPVTSPSLACGGYSQ